MADRPAQNRSLPLLALVVTIVGLLAGVLLGAMGVFSLVRTEEYVLAGLLIAGGLTLAVGTLFLYVISDTLFRTEAHALRLRHVADDFVTIAHHIEPLMRTIATNSQISDGARSIANREIERETLRQAIREEMYGGDLEAAQYLISEIERRFGYKQEAKVLHDELSQVREMTIEEKVNEAISHIHRMMDQSRWIRAGHEIQRLMKLFPQHRRIAALPAEMNRRREARKQELLKEWKVAVDRAEVDRGVAILTELDQYLTPQEGHALQESARHVFKARLLNLAVQFGLAVSENRWRDALQVGLQIRKEFPNSRMAREVSEKTETLRLRAGLLSDANVPEPGPLPTGTPVPGPTSSPGEKK